MKEYCYIVAGHCFSVTVADGVDLSEHLSPYQPFAVDPQEAPQRVFRLAVVLSQSSIRSIKCVEYPELGMEAFWKIRVEPGSRCPA